MMDWSRVKGFDWDAGNARKNADKHGVSQSEAEQVFFCQPLLIASDARHSEQEPRWHALGKTLDQRFLHVTFTLREQGALIRVISARPMHRKERQHYAKAQQAPTRIQDGS
ncbi:BrnT family toxin [Wenzhouxiangella sediminis]|uniref:BrnT family toxin n=1 Tax=Wenzhouxiangella sediminis TaxID=1792836 RepID=A0A3E1K9Q9_9GAMM|nr:BrnT family toxin [Wenzhouxiangella sediminis]RFF30894.1 BrnT family toxin [Wenzhouxiangella sediminis]